MAEERERPGRWWDSKLLIAFIALMGAAIAPTVTYIVQRGELQVERSSLEHTITMDMLRLAIDPELTAEGRRNVMEVLSLVLTEDSLRAWARHKLEQAKKDVKLVDSLRAELARMQFLKDSLEVVADLNLMIGGHRDEVNDALKRSIDSLDISQRKLESEMPYQEQRTMQKVPLEKTDTRLRTQPDLNERTRGR